MSSTHNVEHNMSRTHNLERNMSSTHNRCLVACCIGFALAMSISVARAATVTIEWPAAAMGNYRVLGFLDKENNQTKTFDVPDGKDARIVGAGFDFKIVVEKGKARFAHGAPQGVVLDSAANRISFRTANIQVINKSHDLELTVSRISIAKPKQQEPTPREDMQRYTLVCGKHTLGYTAGTVWFTVDAAGKVSLQGEVRGISSEGSTITVTGVPLDLVTSSKAWRIQHSSGPARAGNAAVFLVPGDRAYVLTSDSPKGSASFFFNKNGMLAGESGGIVEWLKLADSKAGDLGEIMIPGGREKLQARLQKERLDKETHDKLLAASEAAPWKADFVLKEKTQIHDFPEELLSYPINLPAGSNAEQMKLLVFSDIAVRVVPFQLRAREPKNGEAAAVILFRADLPRGAKRLFRLVPDIDVAKVEKAVLEAPRVSTSADSKEAIVGNGRIFVKVPSGRIMGNGGQLSGAPAPILGISRDATRSKWAATGSFVASERLRCKSIETKIVESGPLACIYQIHYVLAGNRTYTVLLELRAGENEVAVSESFSGFTPADAAFFRLDYGNGGLDPDRRLIASNGGYVEPYSGDYSANAAADGKLNVALGLYTPNSLGVMRAATLSKQNGADALLLAVNRPGEWVTSKRAIWSSTRTFENIAFYSKGNQKYLTAGIAGSRRFWVLGLIPAGDVVLTTPEGLKAPAVGPEVRLLNRLSDWSLNAYKERAGDWDEALDPGPFAITGKKSIGTYAPVSFDNYWKKNFTVWELFRWMQNVSWDFSSEVGPVAFRSMPDWFGEYAVSRSAWTAEQREQVRQILLHMADSCADDANLPHHSMLAGHPNFIMDVKATLPLACATFPGHPRAKVWRSAFMEYFNEWIDTYSRKDDAALNTKGGRWTENISCYVGQCFIGVLESQRSIKKFDGTSLYKNPQLLSLVRWMRDAMMSPHDGVRMVPPQGAHARGFEPNGQFWKAFFQFCAEMAPDEPGLAKEMRWMETNGKNGQKPDVRSALFTDYGPVFHYDFGGDHESYAHLQNINGMNYRWSRAGIVYYGARNKAWSYNSEETNGDKFDWKAVSAFTCEGGGLAAGPTDQILYDFDFAQFYRQPGKTGDAYVARSLMLLRDDYLVISDEVNAPQSHGSFVWAGGLAFPEIYQLIPGADAVESTSNDLLPRRPDAPPNRPAKIKSFAGMGDFLTVVAPGKLSAAAKPFGAVVNEEYVFCSKKTIECKDRDAVFSGNYGYARKNQLAIFQGTKIALGGFELRTEGGDFGISAQVDGQQITGRFVGRSGGKAYITPPAGFDIKKASLKINGAVATPRLEQSAISFTIDIAQSAGMRTFEISFQ